MIGPDLERAYAAYREHATPTDRERDAVWAAMSARIAEEDDVAPARAGTRPSWRAWAVAASVLAVAIAAALAGQRRELDDRGGRGDPSSAEFGATASDPHASTVRDGDAPPRDDDDDDGGSRSDAREPAAVDEAEPFVPGDAAPLEPRDAATLERGDAATLERGDAATLERGDAATLERGLVAPLELGAAPAERVRRADATTSVGAIATPRSAARPRGRPSVHERPRSDGNLRERGDDEATSRERSGDEATSRSETSAAAATPIAEEARLLAHARQALARREPERALARIREHARRFADSSFAGERGVLEVRAWCQLGERDEAKRVAEAFVAAFPDSPWAARVQRPCGDEP
jgi:hypothetical protein